MAKLLFVCHGNICRSPMAEFMFKYLAKKQGRENEFYVESAAVSSEEIGNSVHYGTKRILDRYEIDCSEKRARKITEADYLKFDKIIAMDRSNLIRLRRMFGDDNGEKICLMMDYTEQGGEVADPWYTGDFEQTADDIFKACLGILNSY